MISWMEQREEARVLDQGLIQEAEEMESSRDTHTGEEVAEPSCRKKKGLQCPKNVPGSV